MLAFIGVASLTIPGAMAHSRGGVAPEDERTRISNCGRTVTWKFTNPFGYPWTDAQKERVRAAFAEWETRDDVDGGSPGWTSSRRGRSEMRGRVVAFVIAGAVAVGGVGVPLRFLGDLGGSTPVRAAPDLPWPYCAPDAERPAPSPTPWPELPAEADVLVDPAPAPLADLIVVADTAEPGPAGRYPLAPGLAPATVRVREVDWDAGKTSGIAPGDELWLGAPAELLSTGAAEILLGLGERRADGLWSVRFAVAPSGQGATVIGPSPFAERQTAILEAFRTSEDNPASGASARDLILAWNEEVARGGGPIQVAWERFVEEVVLGHVPDPAPGTRAWWEAAPPTCRSVLDAPEDVRRSLSFGTVWVRVPAAWVGVSDAALCLQISLGSVGCSVLPRSAAWPYVRFDEAYAAPGEPVDIRVAHLVEDGAVSWVERRTVARIPYRAFTETGISLVDLAATGATMTSYADLALGADPDRVPIQALGPVQEEKLLLDAPQASPDVEDCRQPCEA